MKMNSGHLRVRDLLKAAGSLADISDSPHLDCQLLLAFSLGQTREWLVINSEEYVLTTRICNFKKLIKRRQRGEPVAYILGHKDFWDMRLDVTRDTLIPRPETELLVETILDTFDDAPRLVVDLGTGSGAIAISLAMARPLWQLVGVDINRRAIAVAKRNAAGITNLDWLQGDWGEALAQDSIDLLVCNPPYISKNDPCLKALSYEPREALISANNGLADLYTVILAAQHLVRPEGHLLLEHGPDQQQRVCSRLLDCNFDPAPLLDLQGMPRAVLAKQRSTGANER
jgi:release factor glutamine methyltransferase